MNEFHAEMLSRQHLADVGYLPQQLALERMPIVHGPNYDPSASSGQPGLDTSIPPPCYDETDALNPRRSVSFGSHSTHSQSPPLPSRMSMGEVPYIHTFTKSHPHALEQPFPGMGESMSKRDSEDETLRAERRRAQNRAAQRAYRQRKDQSLKQREREIENLREELEKAQRLNKTLCKIVAVLRERIKNPPTEKDCT